MKRMPRITLSTVAAMGVCLTVWVIYCRPGPDFEMLRRQILELHRQTIGAHWNKDAGFFAKSMADGYFAVRNGEIQKPTREEIKAEYERYLGSTTFTDYRDLQELVIGFSKDGSVAWCVVQVRVAGRDREESGAENDFDLTWAWITLYGRKGDGWVWLGEASNFKRNM
ncbi:MAG: hypothetical protein H6P98_279 [Candidatus Aminicenantes bacterium]|nr:hypothetical protein [Candidatus Aminicenantes bacterium]